VVKIEKGQPRKSTGVVIRAARGVDGRLRPAGIATIAVDSKACGNNNHPITGNVIYLK